MKAPLNQFLPLPEAVVRQGQVEQLKAYLHKVVLPFSAYYRDLFHEKKLTVESIQSFNDLAKIPFTTKVNLLNTTENPQRFREG